MELPKTDCRCIFYFLRFSNDVYNIYQDCYQQKAVIFGSRNLRPLKESIRQSSKTYRVSPNDNVCVPIAKLFHARKPV